MFNFIWIIFNVWLVKLQISKLHLLCCYLSHVKGDNFTLIHTYIILVLTNEIIQYMLLCSALFYFNLSFSCSVVSNSVPMDCTPGLPDLHYLLELAQTHVLWVSDAIQPSHSLSSSSPALIFASIRFFSNESALHIKWPKYWSFSFSISPSNEYSVLISFLLQ